MILDVEQLMKRGRQAAQRESCIEFVAKIPANVLRLGSTENLRMRKPSRAVQLDDIISSQIIGDDPEIVALVLKTHLALEALLIEMIRLSRSDDKLYRLSFPDKSKWLVDTNVIMLSDKLAFDRFNDFRNDIAHIFGHTITLADALQLARDLESDGIDFSDSAGHYSEAQAEEHYGGTVGILAEIGWCILYQASFILMEAGGRNIFGS